MISKTEYALFSSLAYASSDTNTVVLPAQWDEDEDLDDQADAGTGFAASVFVRGNEIVVAIRGTEFATLPDWTQANFPLAFGAAAGLQRVAALDRRGNRPSLAR